MTRKKHPEMLEIEKNFDSSDAPEERLAKKAVKVAIAEKTADAAMTVLMPLLPKDDLSHWVGRIVHAPLPGPLRHAAIRAFAKAYSIDLNEAEKSLEHYRSIGDLFTRKLKHGVRPVAESDVVHPCDAKITQAGTVLGGRLVQAKGIDYSIEALLAIDEGSGGAAGFEGGAFATYYLCPTDYHRVHAPMDLVITRVTHIPGAFWPVNDWSVRKVKSLYAINERVVFWGETSAGESVAVVMVAATNVGNISVSFDSSIGSKGRKSGVIHERLLLARREVTHKTYSNLQIARGTELGIFGMGSSVVMLIDRAARERLRLSEAQLEALAGKSVKMGSAV